jgi:simple sugar transport system permease protein
MNKNTISPLDKRNSMRKKKNIFDYWKAIRLPILAFLGAFLASAVLIIFTDLIIYALIREAFSQLTTARIILLIISIVLIPLSVWLSVSKRIKNQLGKIGIVGRLSVFLRSSILIGGFIISIFLLRLAGFSDVLNAAFNIAYLAYDSLLEGSLGSIQEIAVAFQSHDIQQITEALNPLSESLVAATPYIFSALSVAVALRCGIFNIGTEGQIYLGALAAVVVGYYIKGIPPIIHIPLAVLAGAAAGAFWASIPAILKIKFGSNEVINTIMLNYVAFKLVEYLLIGPIRRPEQSKPFSAYIQPSAELPRFLPYPNRFHIGFFIAVGVAVFMYWFLFRTPAGLEIRLIGKNPNASRYAGINIKSKYLLAFLISGAMGGLAGANEILGVNHYLSGTISPGFGFDAISLSILGNNHPIGVIFTALLFGFLRSGSTRMQNIARVPIEIITITQALIIGFMAAPAIIQKLFRLKEKEKERIVVTRGWGK